MQFKLTDEDLVCYVDDELSPIKKYWVQSVIDNSDPEDKSYYENKIKDFKYTRYVLKKHWGSRAQGIQ